MPIIVKDFFTARRKFLAMDNKGDSMGNGYESCLLDVDVDVGEAIGGSDMGTKVEDSPALMGNRRGLTFGGNMDDAMGMKDRQPASRRKSKIATRKERPEPPDNPRELQSVTTSIATGLIYAVDEMVWEGIYSSRAAAIEDALKILLRRSPRGSPPGDQDRPMRLPDQTGSPEPGVRPRNELDERPQAGG